MVERNWSEANPANFCCILPLSQHSIPNLPGNKLTLDDLGCVLEEVLDVSAQWYQLGLQLKVKTGTLDRFRAQFSDPRDQLMEMLKTWLTTSDNTTWKTLTDALRSRSVGASQLAGELEKKYCKVGETKVVSGLSATDSQPETYIPPSHKPDDRVMSASNSQSETYVPASPKLHDRGMSPSNGQSVTFIFHPQ